MDLVWGDDRVTHDANDPKLSKWADLQLQIVSFLATLFLLGPAWPWLVLGFKTILVLVVWKIIVRTFSRLINVCPPWIQTAYARSVALYSVCYQILLNSALRGSFNAWDYIDAVRWYIIPWGLRLVGEYVEELFKTKRGDYIYTDVNSERGEIRLLRIHKQYLFWGHIRCSMESFPLYKVPEYEALSYRWGFGSEGPKIEYRVILIDGKALQVPKSSWELLHARSSMYEDRLVWIDAICINQKDIAERVGQIPLMDKIYTKSHRTIVWPGDRFDSGMASRMLLRLYVTNHVFQAKDEEFLLFFEYEIVRPAWRAMIALFENPYFTRIWCVQEVALGKQTEIFHGNKYIPWDVFTETLVSYMRPRRRALLAWSTKDASDQTLWPRSIEGPSGVLVMDLIRKQHQSDDLEHLHIGSLLAHCAQFQATVVKDRIFSVNGLLSETDKITPSYTVNDAEIFFAASVLALKHPTQPFSTLIYAGIGWAPQESDLPSWAINSTRPYNHFTLASAWNNDINTPDQSTATHMPPELSIDKDRRLLHIKGFTLDTIWNQSSAVTRSSAEDMTKTRFQRVLLRSQWYLDATKLSEERFETYPYTRQSRQEAFWRTVLTDRLTTHQPAPQHLGQTHTWYHKLCAARLSIPFEDSTAWHKHLLSTPELTALWPTTLEDRGRLADFSSMVAAVTDGRRFAVTEGGLMCLTPSDSMAGDVIAIFHGAPTPFLLRKDEQENGELYKLVGECWVYGFMNRFDDVSGFKAPISRDFTIV
jgi:hypothetical protein